MIKTILIAFVLVYLVLMVFLYIYQRNLLFVGSERNLDAQQEPSSFLLPSHEEQVRVWHANPGKSKAILYFGGNAEPVETLPSYYASYFPDYTLYFMNYRGFGGEPGQPSQAAIFKDALASYDYIASQHEQISIIGRSLGTGVAVYTASQRPTQQLVLVTPYDSIANVAKHRYWMFPIDTLLKDPFPSFQYAPLITAPILVVKAGSDNIVPHARTDALLESFSTSVQLQVIPNTDHLDVVDVEAFMVMVRQFLD